jgi:hypothetical protein
MSGDGVDTAAVYQLLSEVAKTVVRHDGQFARVFAMMNDMATGMVAEAGLRVVADDLAALRQEVRGYHASVVGHGITPTDHEERLDRLEHATGQSSPNP